MFRSTEITFGHGIFMNTLTIHLFLTLVCLSPPFVYVFLSPLSSRLSLFRTLQFEFMTCNLLSLIVSSLPRLIVFYQI